ncbi:unnamed protein product [Linum tenue]|uniref:Transcription elongation factor 1 homolog n=1 Tax=Linum tenue TaxID=586396 RepID=A0AAV0MEC0_9ROSI|nr:unnamed protein product [Linum tenue]
MGKRKSKEKPPPKKRMDKLDTLFPSAIMEQVSSAACKDDMKNMIGEASCGICQESFSTTITGICQSSVECSV